MQAALESIFYFVMATAIDFQTWRTIVYFPQIVKKSCKLMGVETTSEALTKSGQMGKVPQDVKDAIYMYEYMKRETKENGHTCIKYDKILDAL